ncbi:MAG: hypothetical protein AAF597_05355 [Bacteroidota bacterium]
MVNYRLWEGLRSYGWVAKMLVGVAVVIAIYMITETAQYLETHQQLGIVDMAIGSESLIWQWIKEAYGSLSDGALNWLTLILLEVVIYHFMRQSLKVVLKKNVEAANTFKPFFDAQVRMIKVSFAAFVVESIMLGLGENLFSGGLFWGWSLLFRSLFMGYVIADNYNEQFGLNIAQSARHLRRNYLGICLGLGLPLLLMMEVPVIGTILGPLVTSVTAAIVLREKSDLHIVGYQMSEKERRKAEKQAAKADKKAAKKAARTARKAKRVEA